MFDHIMSRTKKSLIAPLLLTPAALAMLAAPASAETNLYDWPVPDVPVVVVNNQNVIFMHKDGKPYRVYKYKGNKADGFHVTDMDADGTPDVVGVGSPTFVILGNGDPLWFNKKGCKIGLVADLVASETPDLMCADGRKIKILNYDNQLIWEMNPGRPFKKCRLGDTNGDQKADIECKAGKKILRIDGNGTLITSDGDDFMIGEAATPYEAHPAAGLSLLEEQTTFDFDKDGTAEEYLAIDDTLLTIESKSKPKPLSMIDIKGKPVGAMVKDIDADGTPEIIVSTSKDLFVLSPDGKRQDKFAINAAKYKRKPVAELRSVYTNGFADDDAAKASIDAMQDTLAKCYQGQLKKTQFAGSGQLVVMVTVDDQGKVKSVSKTHSEMADKKVDKCAMDKLKKAKPPAAAAGSEATINIQLYFTFRDS